MTERVVRVSLAAQVNGFVNGMNQAEQAARKAKAGSEEATAAYERQKQAMNEAGVALGAVGAVAMASTALAVKAAIDWESAWAGVTKTVDGSASEMAALEDELRSLTSTLPATHEQIAAVAEAAGQLGVRRDDVADFTRTMVNLGETTNLSADQAATSIAQLMNVMQTAPDDVDRLGATLVALGNDGASTESEILEMAQRIAGAGKLVGATEGEVLGLSNALASMGVTAELGGGVASRILQDLYSAVQSGGDQLAGFAKVAGVSAKQFADQFRADPVRALDAFAKGLNDVEASGGNVVATLSDIGFRSTEEQRVLLQLKGAGDLLADSLDLQAVAWEENLALQVEASKRYETTEAKLAIASNGIREAAIDIGSTFLPAVSAGAEAVATLSFAFAGLPQPVQAGVGVVGALGGVVTLTAGAFLLAVPKIAELGATLDVLRTSQMPGVARAADLASAAVTRTTRATAAAARFMTGPWGLALAAASAGALAWVAANEKMQTEAATFRDTLDETTGAVTESTRAMIAKKLIDADVFSQTEQLGIGQAELVDALQKGGDAYEQLLARMRAAHDENVFNAPLGNAVNAVREMGVQLDIAKKGHKDFSAATEGSAGTTKTAAQAYQDTAREAQALVDSLMSLTDTLNASNDTASGAIQANARWRESLEGIAAEVQRQRDEYEEANGTLDGFTLSLDRNTAAGASNAASLDSVATASRAAADAQLQQDLTTMSAEDATRKYIDTLNGQRQAFIDTATQAGYNADEVHALADEIFRVPDEKATDLIVNNAQARDATQQVKDMLSELRDKTVQVKVWTTTVQSFVSDLQNTYGGVQGHARGGPIYGPGTGTSDSILRRLSNGEHVWTAAEVEAAGGHASVAQLRQLALTPNGGATGELVGVIVVDWVEMKVAR